MANVKLSKEESELVCNADFILTKNRIIQKVYGLFGELSEEYKRYDSSFTTEVLSVPPKISRGENYLGLPWVMLDYPRKFSNTDTFAIRSFFWWGKYFSITLQLQGTYKHLFEQKIFHSLHQHSPGWMVCIADDPWEHHFESDNYVPFSGQAGPEGLPFIKLAKKIPLQEWDNSFDFFRKTYCELAGILSA